MNAFGVQLSTVPYQNFGSLEMHYLVLTTETFVVIHLKRKENVEVSN